MPCARAWTTCASEVMPVECSKTRAMLWLLLAALPGAAVVATAVMPDLEPPPPALNLVPVTLPARSESTCTERAGGMETTIVFTNHSDTHVVVNVLHDYTCVQTGSL